MAEDTNAMGFNKLPPFSPDDIPPPHLVNGVPVSVTPGSTVPDDPISRTIKENTEVAAEPAPPPKVAVKPPKRAPARPAPAPSQDVPLTVEEPKAPAPKKPVSGRSAINAFKQAVCSTIFPVQLYSVDEEVNFRELTVTDQKSISKIALLNNSRRDIIYNAQCAMINKCADQKDFHIEDYSEFDRIVILLRLYEQNYFKNDIHYTCAACGKENVYQIDFTKILGKLKLAWTDDKVYTLSHQKKTFRITAGWPKVATISEFYKNYYKTYQNSNDNTKSTIDQLSNVEYLIMFIKAIDLIVPGGEEISLNLDDLSYAERSDVIDSLPQGIIFDDEDGVVTKIVADFTDKLNKAFQYEKCMYCGAETEEGIGSVADFT